LTKLVSKCGIDCGTCPWGPFPRKSMTAQEFERHRRNAKAILGYMPIKTPCAVCQTPDAKIPKGSKLPNRKCLIRQCVDKTGVANCAYCSRFPCDTLKATAGAWNRKTMEEKLGAPLSEENYHTFVEPFEGIDRLGAIRASLKPEEIVEPARIRIAEKRIVDFPDTLSFAEEETAAFKAVHGLLATLRCSSLGLRDTDTFGQHYKLENLRAHVLRFLWMLGLYGRFKNEKSKYLVIDARTFLANRGNEKTLATWSFLKDTVFRVLSEVGISCERIALKGVKETDLVTGTDYLRYTGWVIRMSFDEKAGCLTALRALQTYARRIDEEYGKKAFQRFQDADMRVLAEIRAPAHTGFRA
jgi:Protein of unknown function (DUF3795)